MNTWRNVTINDLGKIITGSTPPTKKTEYYGNEYPFITPTDIEIDSRIVQTKRFLSQKGYEYNKKRLLQRNAVCVVCIASIGKICMTSVPSVTNQQINSVVVNQQKYDPYFVYYLLRTQTDILQNVASGVATPIVNKTSFAKLKVYVPPLPTQHKIAAILSTYDYLIENNTHRIKILEDMAQTLYREWFVHYRFPGHENVPMVESELGPIPQGWEVKPLGEMCHVLMGLSPKSEFYNETPGIDDQAVLSRATAEERILLTADKGHFGRLVFRNRQKAPYGIILFRIQDQKPYVRAQTIVTAIESRTNWQGHFSVIRDENNIRMTSLPTY